MRRAARPTRTSDSEPIVHSAPLERASDALPDESGPERTCIVTREKGWKGGLIRFVVGPERALVPDIRARLPGRGAWVRGDRATLALAVKRKAFARAFKSDLAVPDDLPAVVDRLLEADALQALSLANKAGLVTTGSAKVEKALAERSVLALVHAREAGEDGIRKIAAAAWRRHGAAARDIGRVQIFCEEQLDLALGRVHVIHAVLAVGAASEGFIARSTRLERFRGLEPLSAVGDGGADHEPLTDTHEVGTVGEHTGFGPQGGRADE